MRLLQKKRVRKINELYYGLFAKTSCKASVVNFNMLNLRFFILVPLIRYNQKDLFPSAGRWKAAALILIPIHLVVFPHFLIDFPVVT